MDNDKILQEEGEVILPITHESCVLNDDGQPLTRTIGNVSNLYTRERTLVGAINEVYAASLKQQMVEVLLDKGINCNINMTFVEILDLFRSINSSDGFGLDIISATELPATGKENQICVITDNPTENFIVSAYHDDISALDTSSIGVYLNDNMGVYHNTKVSMTNGGTTTNYYFNRVCQGDNRLSSYIYNNSQWEPLTLKSYPVLESGVKITTHVGTLPVYSGYVNYTEGVGLKLTNGSRGTCAITTGSKLLDFDSLSKAKVTVKNETSAGCVLYIGVCSTPSIGNVGDASYYINMITTRGSLDLSNITSATYTIDLSNVTGDGYLAIALQSSISSKYLYITDLTLY